MSASQYHRDVEAFPAVSSWAFDLALNDEPQPPA